MEGCRGGRRAGRPLLLLVVRVKAELLHQCQNLSGNYWWGQHVGLKSCQTTGRLSLQHRDGAELHAETTSELPFSVWCWEFGLACAGAGQGRRGACRCLHCSPPSSCWPLWCCTNPEVSAQDLKCSLGFLPVAHVSQQWAVMLHVLGL